jgi:hypothetical protein
MIKDAQIRGYFGFCVRRQVGRIQAESMHMSAERMLTTKTRSFWTTCLRPKRRKTRYLLRSRRHALSYWAPGTEKVCLVLLPRWRALVSKSWITRGSWGGHSRKLPKARHIPSIFSIHAALSLLAMPGRS